MLDIINQQIPDTYDVIFASAVFLHFTNEDMERALTHVCAALNHDGKFIFSLKKGVGEAWSTEKMQHERYFRYWTREEITKKIGEYGLELIDAQTFEDDRWLYLTSHKHSA